MKSQKYTIKQSGSNPNYPKRGIFWNYDPSNIPTWITDNFMVSDIKVNATGSQSVILKTVTYSNGTIGLFDISGHEIVIPSKDGIIVSDGLTFYGLTSKQFKYLYDSCN